MKMVKIELGGGDCLFVCPTTACNRVSAHQGYIDQPEEEIQTKQAQAVNMG